MKMKRNLSAVLAGATAITAALTACGPETPEPGPTPTTYDIEKSDLIAPEPNDICRTRKPAFLRDLLLQITEGLPPGSSGFDFRNLSVDRPEPNGKWTVTVRFEAALPGETAQIMRAVAAFDPENCTTGEWLVERGPGVDQQN